MKHLILSTATNLLAVIETYQIVVLSLVAAFILGIVILELVLHSKEKRGQGGKRRKGKAHNKKSTTASKAATAKNSATQKPSTASAVKAAEQPVAKAEQSEAPKAAEVKAVPLSADGTATDTVNVIKTEQAEQPEETEEEPVEETEAVEEEETQGVMTVDGKQVHVLFRKSFTARLIQSKEESKQAYAELANYIYSYGAKGRLSWSYHSFNTGRKNLFKLNVNGKTLRIYFGLTQEEAQAKGFAYLNFTESKKYEKTPAFIRVKSQLAVKRAKAIIDALSTEAGLKLKSIDETVKASDYPYDTTENLITRELIKYTVIKGTLTEDAEIVKADISTLMREKVTAEEAHNLLDDKTATELITKVAAKKPAAKPTATTTTTSTQSGSNVSAANLDRQSGKRYAVNVDDISRNFANGDTVDLKSLKEKGLIPKRAQAVKILARGTLDKAITVYADDYSADAVKMIVLTGGVAMKGRKD